MRIRNTVQEACPVCGKEITLASTEPHPTHPEIGLRAYRCEDCGPVKTISGPTQPRRLRRAA